MKLSLVVRIVDEMGRATHDAEVPPPESAFEPSTWLETQVKTIVGRPDKNKRVIAALMCILSDGESTNELLKRLEDLAHRGFWEMDRFPEKYSDYLPLTGAYLWQPNHAQRQIRSLP